MSSPLPLQLLSRHWTHNQLTRDHMFSHSSANIDIVSLLSGGDTTAEENVIKSGKSSVMIVNGWASCKLSSTWKHNFFNLVSSRVVPSLCPEHRGKCQKPEPITQVTQPTHKWPYSSEHQEKDEYNFVSQSTKAKQQDNSIKQPRLDCEPSSKKKVVSQLQSSHDNSFRIVATILDQNTLDT